MEKAILSQIAQLHVKIDFEAATFEGVAPRQCPLSHMDGYYLDEAAYQARLDKEDALLYTVASMPFAEGEGDMHIGYGRIMSGRIGDEYFMTKGHFHSWRPAAEIYIGLSGEGRMVLENEVTEETRMLSLAKGEIVYVPGSTAHRTLNTGDAPLDYLGIYPARAGHDYGVIAERNFRHVVIDVNGTPTLQRRDKE